jgi:hypothetical protein
MLILGIVNHPIRSNLIHSFYERLKPLIKDLAAILFIDRCWLPSPDPRRDTGYVTEAFQRLILNFIIDNRDEEFMHRRVETTFRKVKNLNGWSSTDLQALDGVRGYPGGLWMWIYEFLSVLIVVLTGHG